MKKVILIATAVLLAGCAKLDEERAALTPSLAAPPAKENVTTIAQTQSIVVYSVITPNGTECIVIYNGGVDCDWDRREGR